VIRPECTCECASNNHSGIIGVLASYQADLQKREEYREYKTSESKWHANHREKAEGKTSSSKEKNTKLNQVKTTEECTDKTKEGQKGGKQRVLRPSQSFATAPAVAAIL
jgi:hypothetical protein